MSYVAEPEAEEHCWSYAKIEGEASHDEPKDGAWEEVMQETPVNDKAGYRSGYSARKIGL
jgi:hypothetical protein